ncbi:MAG TPA: prolyl oligopeptidase family serine peptidase [Vicinamibacterales bacterium]|nr:prolyl oligopeptidase family serine peptidase [Vicinamibacterales bacterium]
MTRRASILIAAAVAVLAWAGLPSAQGQDVAADYARANSLRTRVQDTIFDVIETQQWIEGSSKLWYRKSVKGGDRFVLVDAVARTKAPAFDHARLAQAISTAASGSYTEVTLPFQTFTYVDNMNAIEFALAPAGAGGGRAGGGRGGGAPAPNVPRWRCTITDYQCTRAAAAPQGAGGQGAGPGRGGRQGGGPGGAAADGQPQFRQSPDRAQDAFIQNYNLFVRATGAPIASATQLSWDGSEGNAYTFNSIAWSPDSKKVGIMRRRPGYDRQLVFVQSSPSDQLQPKNSSRTYRKPGDVVDFDQPVIFDVATKTQKVVDSALFPNPYSNGRLEWRRSSQAMTFEYNQRGHQLYRVIEVDANTGQARAVIEETSNAFIDYRRAAPGLSDSGRTYRFDVEDGKEIIWMSERDGWSHLYLYDGATGRVKNQITKGNWAVHYVERVDEANRQIYFTANGVDAGKDPYYLFNFRINFDGTGLTRYTTADGQHTVDWSPNRDFYLDTYSRVDVPPVSELRRASDQSLVLELEKGDITELTATGWRAPEIFNAKGRDGVTDIWGVIIRPTNFDANRKYPVIENIYAGPQGSFVPKTFSTQTGMQSLAELGFIVVQIDGMGTANRSKAFHDVAFKNLGDAGFPDRILWHKAVAAKYPYYDITRVGLYGTSAGGQNAMGGALFHPEFYKAAAASAGCHDNRMDKIWWNEQWMSWPLGPHYVASSNMENAAKLQGALLLIVGEMDTNVDPASTMQVVNKLIEANKDFDLLVIPNAGHTGGGAYGDHKRYDFFVRHLQGRVPPPWNSTAMTNAGAGGTSVLDEDAMPWVASEYWEGR